MNVRVVSRTTFLSLGFCLSLCCSPVLATNNSADSNPEATDSIPISLAISGGISLGSYEAGLNWALVKYLKVRRNEIQESEPDKIPPELMSSVGASAGSINALVSALTWCVDDSRVQSLGLSYPDQDGFAYEDSIDRNLFRTLWLGIGIDEMLPSTTDAYRDGDGILTRAAFDVAINQITETLKAAIFRPDCNVPLGMTVTRVEPVTTSIANVEVENQRFVVPVRLQAAIDDMHSGRIDIVSQLVDKDDPYLGNVMYLRQSKLTADGRYVIEPEHLIESILTSSAYPIAFGAVDLPHCAVQTANDQEAGASDCPPGYGARIDEFIDGGVFDNVPLGVAKALAEPRQWDLSTREKWLQSARPFSYLYLDPDTRREVTPSASSKRRDDEVQVGSVDEEPTASTGIRSHLRFLGGAVATGRQYELYSVLRGREWARHSHDFACELLDALGARNQGTDHCSSDLDPAPGTCEQLVEDQLDSQRDLDPEQREIAAACLLKDSFELDLVYFGNQGADLSAESITRMRLQLLERLQTLAEQSDLQQLALSINQSKQDKLGDRRILLTRRFAPITGNTLGAFGAFIDFPFREYDYHAGIYDAVHGLADFTCRRRPDYAVCVADQSRDIYLKLGISASARGNRIFHLLATHEFPDYQRQGSPWQWLSSPAYFPPVRPGDNMSIIFAALTRDFDPTHETVYEEPDFARFIESLFSMGYDVSDSSQFMQRIHRLRDKNPTTWYYPLTSRVSRRLLELEQESDDADAPLIRGAMGLGAFAVHSYIEDEESKLLIRSAAPADTWMNWLPYEVGADYRNGGLIVSWLPGVDLSDKVSVQLKLTPAHLNRFAGDVIWFSQADLYLSYQREGMVSSFGVGPTYTYTWEDWPGANRANVGASAYIAVLQDKLRFTVGRRSSSERDFAGESIFLYISAMDIPGIAYWLSKGR